VFIEPNREELTGGERILHEKLHNLYSYKYTVTVIKSGRRRWTGHAAHVGDER
jgi:hypothetical protein